MPDLDAARDLMGFIDASPSPFHACATAAARLDAAGFTALSETDAWPDDAHRAYIVRDNIAMQLTEDHTLLARLLAAGIDVDVDSFEFIARHPQSLMTS